MTGLGRPRRRPVNMAEYARLRGQWNTALADLRRDDTVEASYAEQNAYDELVEFVEANDLNYTEYDPRGEA